MGNFAAKEDEPQQKQAQQQQQQQASQHQHHHHQQQPAAQRKRTVVARGPVEGPAAVRERHMRVTNTGVPDQTYAGNGSPNKSEVYPSLERANLAQEDQGKKKHEMASVDVETSSGGADGASAAGTDTGDIMDELLTDDHIPMVFRWDGGGKNVFITGTFNKWSEKIPMRRSGNDFLYIRDLKRGRHAYKFIVDDEWRFATDQPTVADPHGYINNFIDLTNFETSFGAESKPINNQDHLMDDNLYGNFCPDPQDPQWYAKEPPPLPPHLRHIILNTPQSNDCLAAKSMQVPQRVTLNHLYCSAIKENLMVLGVTQRYREKFVTTVFYSPLPDANQIGRAAAQASEGRHKPSSPRRGFTAPPLPPPAAEATAN